MSNYTLEGFFNKGYQPKYGQAHAVNLGDYHEFGHLGKIQITVSTWVDIDDDSEFVHGTGYFKSYDEAIDFVSKNGVKEVRVSSLQ